MTGVIIGEFDMVPLAIVRRKNKFAITGGKSGSYDRTISGLSLSGSETLMSAEEVSELGIPFSEFQLKDMDFLMWEDWDEIQRFAWIPEVATYVIAPMIRNKTHKNLWVS
mgnify:CR=1 FL=1